MSYAWEVTEEDVRQVLAEHAIVVGVESICETYFDSETNAARVESAVLRYFDFEDQVASALDEIESILLEAGVVTEKRFSAPQ